MQPDGSMSSRWVNSPIACARSVCRGAAERQRGECGMSADIVRFRPRREIETLRAFNQRPPRGQRAILDMLYRIVDGGQPFGEAAVEMLVELGFTRRQARQRVREAQKPTPCGEQRCLAADPVNLREPRLNGGASLYEPARRSRDNGRRTRLIFPCSPRGACANPNLAPPLSGWGRYFFSAAPR